MTTYYGAGTLVRTPVQVGAGMIDPDTDEVTHIRAADETILETQVNARLVEMEAALQYIGALHVGGAGDGASWAVVLLATDDDTVGILPAPVDEDSAGSRVFFYRAQTVREIAVQFANCQARIDAWLDEGAPRFNGYYIDHQLAGSVQGANFLGMVLVSRSIPI